MKLYYDRKSKDPTYFIQHGFRNGKKTTTKNVKRIGKHSELLKITDDPLAYARDEVRKFNEEYKSGKVELSLKIDFDEKLSYTGAVASRSELLNIGYLFLQKLYHDMDISSFISDIREDTKATFNCNDINRFLTVTRVLEPASKFRTFKNLDAFYEQPDFDYAHILRFMDILYAHRDEYIEYLYERSCEVIKRDTSVCYFDCTNFYFETEKPDEEYIDPVTGELLTGLRQYGISKQHQPAPLVQMGLFMDPDGIPISMCINPGNSNEQKCAVPLEKKLVKMTKGKPFIYCADAGLGSYAIRKFNEMGGRSFVITQSVKKLSETLKQAVFNDYDYRLLSNDKKVDIKTLKDFDRHDMANLSLYNDSAYKILESNIPMDTGLYEEKPSANGGTRKVKVKAPLKQRIFIIFSRKSMEYQRYIRGKQIERAKDILKTGTVESVKKGGNDVRRFIKRSAEEKKGNACYLLDTERIAQEEKYDGYYAIATNLDDDAKTICKINAQRYRIEDCFKVLKTNFGARPAFHQRPDRLTAHFLICYAALLLYRLLEAKLEEKGYHFTTDELLKTLKVMNVVNFNDEFYKAAYTGSKVCSALNDVFDLQLDKKYYKPKELNKKIKKMQ